MTSDRERAAQFRKSATILNICLAASASPKDLGETLDMFEEAIVAALASVRDEEREAEKWQPIETAPKDGTPILITRPTEFESEEGWHVVRWSDDCWTCHDGKFDTPLRGNDPTAWMPLPIRSRQTPTGTGESRG